MDFPASSGPSNGSSKSGDSQDGSDPPPKENPAGQDSHSDTDVSAKSSEIPPSVQKPKEVQNGGTEETLRKDDERLWLSNETLRQTGCYKKRTERCPKNAKAFEYIAKH